MQEKPHILEHRKKGVVRRLQVLTYCALPPTPVGTIFSDRFKYGRFKNALSNINYERHKLQST